MWAADKRKENPCRVVLILDSFAAVSLMMTEAKRSFTIGTSSEFYKEQAIRGCCVTRLLERTMARGRVRYSSGRSSCAADVSVIFTTTTARSITVSFCQVYD